MNSRASVASPVATRTHGEKVEGLELFLSRRSLWVGYGVGEGGGRLVRSSACFGVADDTAGRKSAESHRRDTRHGTSRTSGPHRSETTREQLLPSVINGS